MDTLNRRILAKDPEGNVIETVDEMWQRVTNALAANDYERTVFYNQLSERKFLPNSPCLVNAGRSYGQLAACFVLPVEDSIDGIMGAAHLAAKIHQTGGGTGFDFSLLREAGSRVKTTGNVASGPNSFIDIFDTTTGAIKQGGVRRGANMGILRVDHPDILAFIDAKRYHCRNCGGTREPHDQWASEHVRTTGHDFEPVERKWTNFNVSVAVTDEFIRALKNGTTYNLISPIRGRVAELSAQAVWTAIAEAAWDTGDPGLFFVDRTNALSPMAAYGRIAATNPCGEVPLLPFETCNLGSINLGKFVTPSGKIDLKSLEHTVRVAVRFLNRVIDNNKFPSMEIERATLATRKVGLGVMGFADLLILLGIKYNTQEAYGLADQLSHYIGVFAHDESRYLAEGEGNFPAHPHSWYTSPRRNSTLTVIAPTGTICRIADASSGIEPLFATEFTSHIMDTQQQYRHPLLGSVSDDLFVTADKISPEDHLKMQAAWQTNVDDSISKTVNMPHESTVDDVLRAYNTAIELGVKGVTVFRDNCLLTGQVLARSSSDETKCPECQEVLVMKEGCAECPNCSWSKCDL